MAKTIIGIIGPGESATKENIETAYKVGKLIAQEGWLLLTGGRNCGVMDSASKGAKDSGGLTIGILPNSEPESVSKAIDISIFTDMGSGRNNINVLSSQVIVACGIGAGTASEIALAIKANKQVILVNPNEIVKSFFQTIGENNISITLNPEETIQKIKLLLKNSKN